MPSSGMTFRTSRTMRWGVGGNRRFVRPVSDARHDFAAQPGKGGVDPQLALDTVGQQCEAGADIADDLGVREVHLLHIGRGKANMYDFRAALDP